MPTFKVSFAAVALLMLAIFALAAPVMAQDLPYSYRAPLAVLDYTSVINTGVVVANNSMVGEAQVVIYLVSHEGIGLPGGVVMPVIPFRPEAEKELKLNPLGAYQFNIAEVLKGPFRGSVLVKSSVPLTGVVLVYGRGGMNLPVPFVPIP